MGRSADPARHVIMTGTDPASGKGGIAFATHGYLEALRIWGVGYEHIATHHPTKTAGKWWWWLRSLPVIGYRILQARAGRKAVTVYSHTGAGVSFFRESVVQLLARVLGARAVLHVHAPELAEYVNRPVARLLLRLAMQPSHAVCLLTPWWVDLARTARLHGNLYVVPNPLPRDWEVIASMPRAKRSGRREVVVLTMARIEAGKGVDLAINAVCKSDYCMRLVVAGDGTQLDSLKKYVFDAGVDDRVKFLGWISGEAKERLFAEADIFCLPTQLDAMPMSILEAMAHGLPVVALDWGPISDLVQDRVVGILAKSPTADAVSQALSELLDGGLRSECGDAAKALVLRKYSSRAVSQCLGQVLSNDSGRYGDV